MSIDDHALELLRDGCSYREAARTTGLGRDYLRTRFPGYGWTYREAGEYRAATRVHGSQSVRILAAGES